MRLLTAFLLAWMILVLLVLMLLESGRMVDRLLGL